MAKLLTKSTSIQTRKMQGTVDIVPKSWNEEERTLEIDFATEKPVLRFSYDGWEYYNEVLEISEKAIDFDALNRGVSILKDHRNSVDSIVGITLNGWIKGKTARAKIKLDDSDDPEATRFRDKVAKGIIRQISVGYEIDEYVRTKKNEKDASETAVYTATRWRPREISFVAVPADENCGSRSIPEDVTAKRELELRNSTDLHTTTLIRSNMEEEDELVQTTDPVTEEPAPKTTSRKAAAPNPVDIKKIEADARKAEKLRTSSIRQLASQFSLDETFTNELLDGDLNLDKVREQVLAKLATNDPANGTRSQTGAGVVVKTDESEKLRGIRVMAMASRTGHFDVSTVDSAIKREIGKFSGMNVLNMARICLTEAGVDCTYMSNEQIARAAVGGQTRGTSSTSDFPELLGGIIHQVMLAAYAEIEDTWRQFCSIGSVGDFREHRMIRSWGLSNLPRVYETEEYKNTPLVDATGETVRVFKYGTIINLSWEMMVNDELDAFNDYVADLTRAYYRTIEDEVYATLALNANRGPLMSDGFTLFHANHRNLITAAAMSTDTLDNIRYTMSIQQDAAGRYTSFRPDTLLVNAALESKAKLYNQAQYNFDQTNKPYMPNISAGLFNKIVSSPRVPTQTAYYAFAKPNQEPVLRVSFLNGNQAPVIEREDEFRTDGFSYKIRGVFGVGAIGWRGAVLNPGA